jgi:hypothetical protein
MQVSIRCYYLLLSTTSKSICDGGASLLCYVRNIFVGSTGYDFEAEVLREVAAIFTTL